jgi:hypothetical protein
MNEDSRRWFTRLESKLFRSRFEYCTPQEKLDFLNKFGFNMNIVDQSEIDRLDSFVMARLESKQSLLFKVPFEQALDLIAMRKVHIQAGFAYVWLQDVVSIVTATFRARLSQNLAATFRSAYHTKSVSDERVGPLLKVLTSNQLKDRAYGYSASHVSTNAVSAAAVQQVRHLGIICTQFCCGAVVQGIFPSLYASFTTSFETRSPSSIQRKTAVWSLLEGHWTQSRRVTQVLARIFLWPSSSREVRQRICI